MIQDTPEVGLAMALALRLGAAGSGLHLLAVTLRLHRLHLLLPCQLFLCKRTHVWYKKLSMVFNWCADDCRLVLCLGFCLQDPHLWFDC